MGRKIRIKEGFLKFKIIGLSIHLKANYKSQCQYHLQSEEENIPAKRKSCKENKIITIVYFLNFENQYFWYGYFAEYFYFPSILDVLFQEAFSDCHVLTCSCVFLSVPTRFSRFYPFFYHQQIQHPSH